MTRKYVTTNPVDNAKATINLYEEEGIMDEKEFSRQHYGTDNLISMICVGPIWGRGHGSVFVPPDGVSCPNCGGHIVAKEYYIKVLKQIKNKEG